jgi:hypothetical protein
MKTLTTIESNVLNNVNVRNGLNLQAIATATANVSKKSKSSVNTTFETAKLIKDSVDYFKSKECKQIFVANGLLWKLEDFFNHIGYGKQWVYKLLQAVKIGDEKFQQYLSLDQLTYSIDAFVLWANDKPKAEKVENKLTLTFGDSKLSISDKNELTTKMTADELKAIITLLIAQVEILSRK